MEVMVSELTSCRHYDRLIRIIEQASRGIIKNIIESDISDDMKFGAICVYLWTSEAAGIYTEIQDYMRQTSFNKTLDVGLNPADPDSRSGDHEIRCLNTIIQYIIKYITEINRPPALSIEGQKPCCDEYIEGHCKLFYRWQQEDFKMNLSDETEFTMFQGFTASSDNISSAANISNAWLDGPHTNPILFVIECSNHMEKLYLSIDKLSEVPSEKEFLFIPSLVSELVGVYTCLPSEMRAGFRIPCSPDSQTELDVLKPMGYGAERILTSAENIRIIHLRAMGFYKNGLSKLSININLPFDLDSSGDIEAPAATTAAPEAPAQVSLLPSVTVIQSSNSDRPGFTVPFFSIDALKGEEDNSFSTEGGYDFSTEAVQPEAQVGEAKKVSQVKRSLKKLFGGGKENKRNKTHKRNKTRERNKTRKINKTRKRNKTRKINKTRKRNK